MVAPRDSNRITAAADRHQDARETGAALAGAAYERGERLTAGQAAALAHWSMWGSAGYPVRKLGRGWTIDHAEARGFGLFRTKGAAVLAWETLIEMWIRLKGLQQHDEAAAAEAKMIAE